MADKEKGGKKGSKASDLQQEGAAEADDIARYKEILAREPSSLVFAALAEAYRRKDLPDEAIAVCRRGLHHHPEFVSGRVALARAYVGKGETDRAVKELERVILTAPDNLIAQGLLLSIYEDREDWDDLEKTVHRILSVDPCDERAKRAWKKLQGHAEEDPADAPSEDRSREIVTQTLAEIYASQGYNDKAFQIYRQLSLRDPENRNLHERLADLKQRIVPRSPRAKTKEHTKGLSAQS